MPISKTRYAKELFPLERWCACQNGTYAKLTHFVVSSQILGPLNIIWCFRQFPVKLNPLDKIVRKTKLVHLTPCQYIKILISNDEFQ